MSQVPFVGRIVQVGVVKESKGSDLCCTLVVKEGELEEKCILFGPTRQSFPPFQCNQWLYLTKITRKQFGSSLQVISRLHPKVQNEYMLLSPNASSCAATNLSEARREATMRTIKAQIEKQGLKVVEEPKVVKVANLGGNKKKYQVKLEEVVEGNYFDLVGRIIDIKDGGMRRGVQVINVGLWDGTKLKSDITGLEHGPNGDLAPMAPSALKGNKVDPLSSVLDVCLMGKLAERVKECQPGTWMLVKNIRPTFDSYQQMLVGKTNTYSNIWMLEESHVDVVARKQVYQEKRSKWLNQDVQKVETKGEEASDLASLCNQVVHRELTLPSTHVIEAKICKCYPKQRHKMWVQGSNGKFQYKFVLKVQSGATFAYLKVNDQVGVKLLGFSAKELSSNPFLFESAWGALTLCPKKFRVLIREDALRHDLPAFLLLAEVA